jgi:hypothetical protein
MIENLVAFSAFTALLLGLSPAESLAGGSECVNGTSVRVCVEWSLVADPELTFDFDVDFSDALNPDIDLMSGDSDWIVYAEVISTGAPANIGSLTTTDSEHYVVTIINGTDPGAADVGSMVLRPTDNHHSSLAGGTISGDLTGPLALLADSSGNGGDITGWFSIGGHDSGTISVPKISGTLLIQGDLTSNLTVSNKHGGWHAEGQWEGGVEGRHRDRGHGQ